MPGGNVDLAYVIAGLAVPAATVLGLWWWLARSRASASAQPDADLDTSDLAETVAAVQDRLTELSAQLETMREDWEERDRRLSGKLNALLALTERATRIDLPIGGKPGTRRSLRP
jgi:HAMP domain-containing protein